MTELVGVDDGIVVKDDDGDKELVVLPDALFVSEGVAEELSVTEYVDVGDEVAVKDSN